MQKLNIGDELRGKSAETLKKYLDKKYVLQHIRQLEYTVIYDKSRKASRYRLLSKNDNTSIDAHTLYNNDWRVIKVPKLISFKAIL